MTSMNIKPPVKVVEWVGDGQRGFLRLLDQTRLPMEQTFVDCRNTKDVWDCIRRLVVRGAPAIGVAAAYGMVVAAQAIDDKDFGPALTDAGEAARAYGTPAWREMQLAAMRQDLSWDASARRYAALYGSVLPS